MRAAISVCHSEVSIALSKIDNVTEKNHVLAIHQKTRPPEGLQTSFLQLTEQRFERFAGIRLHDQVVASKKLGR